MQAIRFGLWDPGVLKKFSTVEIKSKDLFDKRGEPVPNGIFDLRLGTVSRDHICATCNGDIMSCPGHFGYVELHTPVYHILFLKQVVKILQCVCSTCRKPVVKDPYSKFLTLLETSKKKKKCDHCETPVRKYEHSKLSITYTDPGVEPKRMRADECYLLFSKLDSETVQSMHLSYHPKFLLLTRFPIPPPQTHPPISYGVQKSFDDMTNKLVDIVRTNASIVESEGEKRDGYIEALQTHISLYFDSESVPVTGRPARPTKGLVQRLKSKEGRIRGNLNGKRVNFSARTVLTGDPTLRLEEVGIPACIADTITFPVTVTPWNKRSLEKMVAQNKVKTLMRANGVCIDLRIAKPPVRLEEGDTVERTIQNGDPIIFNRQPTLHRMSMMCHYAKILPGRTFRINLSATSPYNADCDGDELNIHVPQNYEAWMEMKEIMDVRKNVVSSQANKPVISLVQDSMLAMYRMTNSSVWFTKAQASQMVVAAGLQAPFPDPAILRPTPMWSGKQLVSMTIPPIDMDRDVRIVNGHILDGRLTKKNVGGNGGLVHLAWLNHGPNVCGRMISEMQFLAHQYMLLTSFSVGLRDMVYGLENQAQIDEMVHTQVKESMDLMRTAATKGLPMDAVEENVVRLLDHARDASGSFVRDGIPETNNLKQMVESGAKGSNINISQICGCVGLQHIEGKRPESTFDQTRCLPHFEGGDTDPRSRGFIRSSYLQGLNPSEFFFHAMAGREGVIDTAIRTSETGYVQREFVKLLEDIHVAYDGTIRNGSGEVLQFQYGGDGLDPTYLQMQTHNRNSVLLPFTLSQVCKENGTSTHPEPDTEEKEPIPWDDISSPVRSVMESYPEPVQQRMWNQYRAAKVEPGTAVGIIAAQSLGEVSTQLALNSVSYDTELLLNVRGRFARISIGPFVDTHISCSKDAQIQRFENGTEWVSLEECDVRVESLDAEGRSHWTRVEGACRHPVVNEDGSDTIVRYTMASGRVIEVTRAKGLLKKVGNELIGVTSSNVDVGDYLPIADAMDPIAHGTVSWLTQYEWDPLYVAIGAPLFKAYNSSSPLYKPWTFDMEFGWFIGRVLGSGEWTFDKTNGHRLSVDMGTGSYHMKPTQQWLKTHDVDYEIRTHRRGLFRRPKHVIHIRSEHVAFVVKETLRMHRRRVRFPVDWIRTPETFRIGVMRGFVGPPQRGNAIHLQFPNPNLCEDFVPLLATIGVRMTQLSQVRTPEIRLMYRDARTFSERVWNRPGTRKNDPCDIIPDTPLYDADSTSSRPWTRNALQSHLELHGHRLSNQDITTIRSGLEMEAWFDRVVAKEEVRPRTNRPLMYDLTVERTRNFCTYSRLVVRDSFHHTGTTGSITSGGVPRLKRLIHASKEKTEINVLAPPRPGLTAASIVQKYVRVPIKSLILSTETIPWDETKAQLAWKPIPSSECMLQLNCDRVRMLNHGVSMADLCAVIARDMEKCAVFGTHLNDTRVEVYVALEHKSMIGLFLSELMDLTIWPGYKGFSNVEEVDQNLLFRNVNLLEVFDCEDIVPEQATTTSLMEAFETLGVEAARSIFITEMKRVFESAGTYLNHHHYELLSDVIFQTGKPMPISRHGVRDSKGPLGRASFETTIETLCSAAMNESVDHLNGVSERVMTGSRIRIGTGQCKILVDPMGFGEDDSETEHETDPVFVPSSPTSDVFEPSPPFPPLDSISEEDDEDMEESWVPE